MIAAGAGRDLLRSSATISDEEWVQAIASLRERTTSGGFTWVTVTPLAELLGIHENRVRSKARRAYRRGLSTGCVCGCRGDFRLTPKGEQLLTATSVTRGPMISRIQAAAAIARSAIHELRPGDVVMLTVSRGAAADIEVKR